MPKTLRANVASGYSLEFKIFRSLFREDMSRFAFEGEVDRISVAIVVFHVDRRNDDDNIFAICIDMEVSHCRLFRCNKDSL